MSGFNDKSVKISFVYISQNKETKAVILSNH